MGTVPNFDTNIGTDKRELSHCHYDCLGLGLDLSPTVTIEMVDHGRRSLIAVGRRVFVCSAVSP